MRTRPVKQKSASVPPPQFGLPSRPFPVQAKLKAAPTSEKSQEEQASNTTRVGPGFDQVGIFPAGRNSGVGALPEPLRKKMETAFHADFSDVRVHPAATSADSLSALAFTQGRDIHFAPGKYNPASLEGQKLIGHELAHVVQQRSGKVAAPFSGVAPVNEEPALEAQADAWGEKASRSAPVKDENGSPDASRASTSAYQGNTRTAGASPARTAQVIQPDRGKRKRQEEEPDPHPPVKRPRVFHMDSSGVAHNRPDPIPKSRQAPPVTYMDPHSVGHKQPESDQINLPPRMVGMPYHRQFDTSGNEQPMKSVLVRHPKDSNKFAEADDNLREMMFGATETTDNSGTKREPMKPGTVFGEDTDGNLIPVDHTENTDDGPVTFKSSPPVPMTSDSGFRNATRASAIELASDGHSLITTSQVNSGQIVDPSNPSVTQDNITSPRLAVNWGRHDPVLDDATLKERLTNGAMKYDTPNSASTPVSSRFSSYKAYNESFDTGAKELVRQTSSGTLALGPSQNSAKIEATHGSTAGEYFEKTGSSSKAKATNLFSGVTSNKNKPQHTVNAPHPTSTSSAMINFNISSSGEPKVAQHYPVKPLTGPSLNVTTGNFPHGSTSGPGPGTTIQDPREVVKRKLTQELEATTGGPLEKNPYDDLF